MGLEPMISRTTIWRANQLHHTHHITYRTVFCPTKYHHIKFSGLNEPGGIRTLDLRLRRPLLYPAELQTHFSLNENLSFSNEKRVMGIEPTYPAWKAGVLPLNYTRISIGVTGFEPATSWSQTRRSSQAEPHPDVFFMLRHLRDTICIIGHVFLNVNTFFKFFYFLFFSEFFKVNAGILPTFTPIHITALTDTLSQRMPFPLCLMSLPCSSAVCRSVLDRSYYPDST